jgi:hypothetical protein
MIDGRTLDIRLFGINNQNFIMRDDETGSWWQQVSGEAIQGPLKGRRLRGVYHDEVSFRIWKSEHPGGRVLKPVPGKADDYAPANWERRMKKVETVTPRAPGDPLEPRAVIVGVTLNGRSKAYPFPLLRKQSPVQDILGGVPIVLVVGDDGKSIRVFDRRLDGGVVEILARAGVRPRRLFDAGTGSEWDFAGRAVSGPLAGRVLARVRALKEYWFDWRTYQPSTAVYTLGDAKG